MKTAQDQIRSLIAEDELEEALKLLQLLWKNSPQLDAVMQQSGRLQWLNAQRNAGVLHFDTATTDRNQIRLAIIELVDEIDMATKYNPNAKKEVDNFNLQQVHQGRGHNVGSIAGDFVQGDKVQGDKVIHNDNRSYKTQFRFDFSMVIDGIFGYFSTLMGVLLQPVDYISSAASLLQKKTPPLVRSLIFLTLCLFIVLPIQLATPQLPNRDAISTIMGKSFGSIFINWLAEILTYLAVGAMIVGVWRLLGKKWSSQEVIAKTCFLLGGLNLLVAFGIFAGSGISSLDPMLMRYKAKMADMPNMEGLQDGIMAAIKNYDPATGKFDPKTAQDPRITAFMEQMPERQKELQLVEQSPVFKIGNRLGQILILGAFLWLAWAWRVYRSKDEKTTRSQSVLSFLISMIGLIMISFFSELISTGLQMQSLPFPKEKQQDQVPVAEQSEIQKMKAGLPCKVMAKVRTEDGLNLRSAPSTTSKILATIPVGTGLIVEKAQSGPTAKNPDAFWAKVTHNGLKGWVFGLHLSFEEK